ncbi:MAG: CPBP family intramembrane metalloprotease [Oscillospiraceae bacterium]|nr:CPBP family intramembrane metalloprotease [Oscillospiraceae bacterium]
MNSKKMTIIRLVIFYTLAILPLIIVTPIFSDLLGEPLYTGKAAGNALNTMWGIIGMCCPAIANVLTRIITREGLKDSYLKLDMQKGRWKYYLLAFVIPLCYMIISAFLILQIFYSDVEPWFTTEDVAMKFWAYFSQIGTTLLLLLPFFGEEFGWRAYLTPKLEELMPTPAALIVSGILWGLWHAPLTVQGHNFGIDYPGFPYLGILLMCVMCISLGTILTFLTKRTQSVFPAAIMHGINNQMGLGIFLMLFGSEQLIAQIESINHPKYFSPLLVTIALFGAVCFIILTRDYLKEKKIKSE